MNQHSPFEEPAIRMLQTKLTLKSAPGPQVLGPDDAAGLIYRLVGNNDREHFVALYLNARHRVTHVHTVSIGTLTSTQVFPREVFKGAVLANAAALVVGHNHPSGDATPSEEDKAAMTRLKAAGELIGIELLDAIIVTPTGEFFSFAGLRLGTIRALRGEEVADGS